MNILLLGSTNANNIYKHLTSIGENVVQFNRKLEPTSHLLKNVEFIISYGYRYIISPQIIENFENKIINLHISYLPWNRGADPNFWSFLEDTPKGVTIHYIDKNLDTGDILVQEEISYNTNDTLKTTYERLTKTIEDLFRGNWLLIREGKLQGKPQPKSGTFHKLADKEKYSHLLISGWDTPVVNLIGKAYRKVRY